MRRKTGDGHEFLPLLQEIEERPVLPWGHIVYWGIILLIIVIILWLNAGRVDVVVSGRGEIECGEGGIEIESLGGEIAGIYVEEGEFVERGRILAEVVPTGGEPELELKNIQTQERIMREELAEKTEMLREERLREGRLRGVRDIIAGKEYESSIARVKELEHEVNRIREGLEGLEVRKEQTGQRRQRLTAPESGNVWHLRKRHRGEVVTVGEPLMIIIPTEGKMRVRAQIRNEDIGFVREGMPVSVKVDAYNFQQYGVIEGEVVRISSSGELDERRGNVYEVEIELKEDGLNVEGEKRELRAGMTVTADIRIGERRMIEFFIYPLTKYMEEGLKVR